MIKSILELDLPKAPKQEGLKLLLQPILALKQTLFPVLLDLVRCERHWLLTGPRNGTIVRRRSGG